VVKLPVNNRTLAAIYVTPATFEKIVGQPARTNRIMIDLKESVSQERFLQDLVNADEATINRVIERTGINYVQLHGEESPELVPLIHARCIKAFRVRDDSWLAQVRSFLQRLAAIDGRWNLSGILLDAYDPSAHGGTGSKFNWELVSDARLSGAMAGIDPIILAGGLDAACVGSAIEVVKPWAVDVASGVEKAPGVKDLKKVAEFIRATHEGDELKSEFWR
jgi:phosphoribosylanthranilate isomerase